MTSISRRSVVGAALLAGMMPATTLAQPVVRVVFPFGAGGAADGLLRLIAEHLRKSLQAPVIVENRTGAAGRIGAMAVKDAAPDGLSLLFAAGAQMTLQPHVYKKLGYDPFKDFVPVSQAFTFDLAIVTNPGLPARSLEELIAWLRQDPDRGAYGSPGAGTVGHFVVMEIARMAGLNLRHTPYRGTPAAMPDLISGRLPFYMASAAEMIEQHKAGRIRILATTGASRMPNLPGIATLKESGFNIAAGGWFAFYAPARTSTEAVTRVERAVIEAVRAQAIRDKIAAAGFQPTGTTAQELAALQRAEFDYWAPIVKASNYKAD